MPGPHSRKGRVADRMRRQKRKKKKPEPVGGYAGMMPAMGNNRYAVDRMEGNTAVVQSDRGRDFDVPSSRLPAGTRGGSVLNVGERGGIPDFTTARADAAETTRRMDEGRASVNRLRKRKKKKKKLPAWDYKT